MNFPGMSVKSSNFALLNARRIPAIENGGVYVAYIHHDGKRMFLKTVLIH